MSQSAVVRDYRALEVGRRRANRARPNRRKVSRIRAFSELGDDFLERFNTAFEAIPPNLHLLAMNRIAAVGQSPGRPPFVPAPDSSCSAPATSSPSVSYT